MLRECFSAADAGRPVKVEEKLKGEKYRHIFNENLEDLRTTVKAEASSYNNTEIQSTQSSQFQSGLGTCL